MFDRRTLLSAALGLSLLVAATPLRASDVATPNDTARFLAGLAPTAGSPLAPLTKDPAWQSHARSFDQSFGRLDERQFARIRAWSAKNVTSAPSTMFYMFSGPDFIYANAVYPDAKTYVMAALEPIGSVPDLTKLRGTLGPNLRQLHASTSSILSYSFFITERMKSDLRAGQVNGALPILYVFLARSGKTIDDVASVWIDDQGVLRPAAEPTTRNATPGVKITFSGADGTPRTLYYFSTDLSDGGVRNSGFLKFCDGLAPGASLVKSASYLLHSGNFSKVRDFLLTRSAMMVQDDSGIPLAYYDSRRWELKPYGKYLGPISIFPGRHQAGYANLFRKSQPIDFGIGYRWRSNESNLLVAVKSAAAVQEASAMPTLAEPDTAATRPAAAPGERKAVKRARPQPAAGPRRQAAQPQQAWSPFYWFQPAPYYRR